MAVYSERYKYVFFAVPNTASKAVAKTLREKLDGVTLPDRKLVAEGERRHHATPSQLVRNGCLTQEQLKGLLKFTTIRNPFDAMVSKYVKHCELIPAEGL
ncbi:MAG: hypothetical protein C4K60_12480 [Ideonella sp. MAG2]|nr:MAG: hypothetical protein C4K60_12480 [Ideonella sp. MAG2]